MKRIIEFLFEVKAELVKVVWPSKRQTAIYTSVVIGTSLVVAVILAAADYGLLKLLEEFVNK